MRPGRTDGCGVFWKKATFSLERYERINFDQMAEWPFDNEPLRYQRNCGALIVELIHRATSEKIFVATTHIFWNPKFEDVKLRQVMFLLHKMARHLCESLASLGFDPYMQQKFAGKRPGRLILCGDFSSTPSSAIYSLIRLGKLNLDDWNPAEVAGRLSQVSSASDVRQAPCDLSSFCTTSRAIIHLSASSFLVVLAKARESGTSRREQILDRFPKDSRKLFTRMTSTKLKHRLGCLQSAYQFYNIYDSSTAEKSRSTSVSDRSDQSAEDAQSVQCF